MLVTPLAAQTNTARKVRWSIAKHEVQKAGRRKVHDGNADVAVRRQQRGATCHDKGLDEDIFRVLPPVNGRVLVGRLAGSGEQRCMRSNNEPRRAQIGLQCLLHLLVITAEENAPASQRSRKRTDLTGQFFSRDLVGFALLELVGTADMHGQPLTVGHVPKRSVVHTQRHIGDVMADTHPPPERRPAGICRHFVQAPSSDFAEAAVAFVGTAELAKLSKPWRAEAHNDRKATGCAGCLNSSDIHRPQGRQ
mmetsp:Transcript_34207/g.79546  ORF Transcript_34207/g.79546 Transcript_34207/m.79546 type:complete len:250 (-) Transcript_34207:566-1315(-)